MAVVPTGPVTENVIDVTVAELMVQPLALLEIPLPVVATTRLLAARPGSWPALVIVAVSTTLNLRPLRPHVTLAFTCLKSFPDAFDGSLASLTVASDTRTVYVMPLRTI